MAGPRWLLLALIAALSTGIGAEEKRDPRGWFDRNSKTVTKMVTSVEMVTELLPSSCVVVQTDLPQCRHIRAVDNIQPTQPVRIMPTMAPNPMSAMTRQGWRPVIQPSSAPMPTNPSGRKPTPRPDAPADQTTTSFWSNWNPFNFGDREVVVTSIIKEMRTTKVVDPHTVVTFSVKGCRPSRLPFDLPECTPQKAIQDAIFEDVAVAQEEIEHDEVEQSKNVGGDVISHVKHAVSSGGPSSEYNPPAKPVSGVYNVGMDPGIILMAPIQLVPNMAPVQMPDSLGKPNKKKEEPEVMKDKTDEKMKEDEKKKVDKKNEDSKMDEKKKEQPKEDEKMSEPKEDEKVKDKPKGRRWEKTAFK